MAAQYIELPSFYSGLDEAERTSQYATLCRRLSLSISDIELSFGVSYETARTWSQGLRAPSIAVIVALSAIESLEPDERGAFIARREKRLSDKPTAVADRERRDRKRAEAAELARRPPLSAKQAGRVTAWGRA
jgi:hypothetical protein